MPNKKPDLMLIAAITMLIVGMCGIAYLHFNPIGGVQPEPQSKQIWSRSYNDRDPFKLWYKDTLIILNVSKDFVLYRNRKGYLESEHKDEFKRKSSFVK